MEKTIRLFTTLFLIILVFLESPAALRSETSAYWAKVNGDYIYFRGTGRPDLTIPSMRLTTVPLSTGDVYGNPVLLQSDGEALLIDTCMPGGAGALKTLLEKENIRHLSVLITHYHNDHIGSLPYLLDNSAAKTDPAGAFETGGGFTIDTIYLPDDSYMFGDGKEDIYDFNKAYDAMAAIHKKAKEKNISIRYIGKGDVIRTGLVRGEVIYQTEKNDRGKQSPSKYINNHSLCLMFTCGNVKYLNCADIEAETEKEMLGKGLELRADIFSMNHHGGKSSNTDAFLDAVSADMLYYTCPSDGTENIEDLEWCCSPVQYAERTGNVFHSCINKGLTFTVIAGRIHVDGENLKSIECDAIRDVGRVGRNAPVKIHVNFQDAGNGTYHITDMMLPYPYVKLQ